MSQRIPQRIQMSRQHKWREQYPGAIIVDRRSPLGNPFPIIRVNRGFVICDPDGLELQPVFRMETDATSAACELFRVWLLEFPFDDQRVLAARATLPSLAGRGVACWCPRWDKTIPCPVCHGEGEGPTSQLVKDHDPIGSESDWTLEIGERCPTCEGTGFTRYPCHGDVLLRLANPDIQFPWVVTL